MECPICKAEMRYECDTMNGMVCESFEECTSGCGMYAEEFAYGANRVFIRGVEYPSGDPTTAPGSLQAWKIWFAIVEAREAYSDGQRADARVDGGVVREHGRAETSHGNERVFGEGGV